MINVAEEGGSEGVCKGALEDKQGDNDGVGAEDGGKVADGRFGAEEGGGGKEGWEELWSETSVDANRVGRRGDDDVGKEDRTGGPVMVVN